MKNTLIIGLLLVTSFVFSQKTITKNVGDFSELKVFDLIVVNLIPASENKIVITGEHAADVKVINDNGTLKIRMYLDNRFKGEDTTVDLYYSKLKIIDANEGSKITSQQPIVQNTIELKTQEGAIINIPLDVHFIKAKAVSGGIINLYGKAQTQDIMLNSGGIYEAQELISNDVTLKITAGGEAQIYANDSVTIRVSAGGNVLVYGHPKEVSQKTFAGGNIRFVD
jgi:hypothetical protein